MAVKTVNFLQCTILIVHHGIQVLCNVLVSLETLVIVTFSGSCCHTVRSMRSLLPLPFLSRSFPAKPAANILGWLWPGTAGCRTRTHSVVKTVKKNKTSPESTQIGCTTHSQMGGFILVLIRLLTIIQKTMGESSMNMCL